MTPWKRKTKEIFSTFLPIANIQESTRNPWNPKQSGKQLAVYTKIKQMRISLSSKIPYPTVDRVRFQIATDDTGLKLYKFPQEEADRIERLLKGGLQFTI